MFHSDSRSGTIDQLAPFQCSTSVFVALATVDAADRVTAARAAARETGQLRVLRAGDGGHGNKRPRGAVPMFSQRLVGTLCG